MQKRGKAVAVLSPDLGKVTHLEWCVDDSPVLERTIDPFLLEVCTNEYINSTLLRHCKKVVFMICCAGLAEALVCGLRMRGIHGALSRCAQSLSTLPSSCSQNAQVS